MMNMKKNIILFAFLFVGVLTGYCQQSAYLFVYFTGNRMSEEAVRMAVSLDGYNYKALNGNQPVLLEQFGHFFLIIMRPHGNHMRFHQITDPDIFLV